MIADRRPGRRRCYCSIWTGVHWFDTLVVVAHSVRAKLCLAMFAANRIAVSIWNNSLFDRFIIDRM